MPKFNPRPALAGALLSVSALAACSTVIDGTPTCPGCGAYSEPEFPTRQPSTAPTPEEPPVAAPPTGPAEPAPQPDTAVPRPGTLSPNESGLVFIETKSGKTRCQLDSATVACESQFDNAPEIDGIPANGVSVDRSGNLRWVLGNLGAIPTVTIDYATYHAVGWTIAADASGTRFTNDGSGHGMLVATEGVQSF